MARKSILLTVLALAALALAGCGSSSKAPTAIDTAPPAPPADLAVAQGDDGAVVSWAPNTTDADCVGFVVRRTVRGHVEMLVATPTMTTEIVDAAPRASAVNVYEVSAVDLAGNVSAYASVALDLTLPGHAPDPVAIDRGDQASPSGDAPGPIPHPGDDRHDVK